VTDARFEGNQADYGGAMRAYGPSLERVVFEGNAGDMGGGLELQGDAWLADVRFVANTAVGRGGAVHSWDTLYGRSVVFEGNSAGSGGAVGQTGGAVTLEGAVFVGNVAGRGGALYVHGVNQSYDSSGSAALTLRGAAFAGNEATYQGGAVYVEGASNTTLADAVLAGNGAGQQGGALHVEGWFGTAARARLTVRNVSFAGNEGALSGGAIDADYADVDVSHASFDGNASASGATLRLANTIVLLTNSALWDAGPAPTAVFGAATSLVENTCVPGGLAGAGNVDLDGLSPALGAPFASPPSGQLFLAQAAAGEAFTSACVDAGSDVHADASVPDWRLRTTRSDQLADATPADAGHHLGVEDVVIWALAADATQVSWDTQSAVTCALTNDVDSGVVSLPSAAVASGATAHGQPSGTRLALTCFGPAAPAVATVVVP
jgi:predicted outer membrane repeat protein